MSSASDVIVGPWGGNGGTNPFTYKPAGRISEIRIKSGDVVDSVRFTYTDDDKVTHHSETYGGDDGTAHTITFADDEKLTGISGTVGACGSINVITSLTFETNKSTYGPYGTTNATTFSIPVAQGKLVGFTGNYGDYLDSIGVILNSN